MAILRENTVREGSAMSEMPRADLAINQPDVALIFEGAGMRNS